MISKERLQPYICNPLEHGLSRSEMVETALVAHAALSQPGVNCQAEPTAFERGVQLALNGGGLSDIWAACKSDDELSEVERCFRSADPLRNVAKERPE